MSKTLGLVAAPIRELADEVFRDADTLVDTDPIALRDLAYSAARMLQTVANQIAKESSDD